MDEGEHAAGRTTVLKWSVRIVVGVVVLGVLALVFWACTLSTLGDDANEEAEAGARTAAQRLSTRLDVAMTDDEIAEVVRRSASSVIGLRREQEGTVVVTVLVRGTVSSIPGPVTAELCYEFTLLADSDVRYRELPECPRVAVT